MKVTVDKIEKNTAKLTITVESGMFKEALNSAYKKNVKSFNIPGFRKGKAPLHLIKKMYGEKVFYQEAEETVINKTLFKAIADEKLVPVGRPEIESIESEEGKDFTYVVNVTTLPEVELGEYKNLAVEKVKKAVTEEAIENELKSMQEKNARIIEKSEGIVEDGDTAIIDFEGFIDGEAFKGGKGDNYELVIGSHSFVDTFEEQLIGLKKDDSKDVVVTFPESYGRDELNGKEATFKVTIKDIKSKELPEINDEFAKDTTEFDSLEELKADIKKRLTEYNEHMAKHEFEEKVIDEAVKNASIDIPRVMIEDEISRMMKDLEQRLKYQGIDLETYYKFTNTTAEKVKEMMNETAEKRVKTDLVLTEISKKEDIKVTEEEIEEKAKETAKRYSKEASEDMVNMLMKNQREAMEYELTQEKVIKLLVDNVK